MSLSVERVEYRDFRNMDHRVVEPSAGLTILVGHNAVGKTNCIEGIYLLTRGKTFRHVSGAGDFVRQGSAACSVRARVCGEKRVIDLAYEVAEGKRRLLVNGKSRRMGEGGSILPSVLFYPDDLMVIKGSASGRRDLVDDIGVQLNESYARVSRDYQRALMQRNSLLRDGVSSGGLFEAWTESLVRSGSMLYLYRKSLLDRIMPHVRKAYDSIAQGESLSVGYESDYAPSWVEGEARPSREQVEEQLARGLAESSASGEEGARRTTVVGPHRDDVSFFIDGRSARLFGSQGQQRTISLAVKVAHVRLVHEIRGLYPVFLLDDVMSELDAHRREALFGLIDTGVQTIMTTTNLDYFTEGELERARVVRMGHEQ